MKRILLSLALIFTAGSALAVGSTGAFFTDSETSANNVFTAGAIDLKIDNQSYYNGNSCSEVSPGTFQWVGAAPFPVAGSPCTTSWALDDLNNGAVTLHKFFDFADVKPSDYSEDTISLHVNNNNSYLCANVKLTSNEENGINGPEAADGDTTSGPGQGELAQNINFIWWADDGDNVLEQGENVISTGPIGAIGNVGDSVDVPLADSLSNIWNPGNAPGPIPGAVTKYIGKAWCFGTITPAPLSQSSLDGGRATTTPAQDGNGNTIPGEPADGGYLCNGSQLNNTTQTDSLTADVTFSAVQSRNNAGFRCIHPTTLTLIKAVNNQAGGNALASAWTLSAAGPTPISGITGAPAVTNVTVTPGAYTLSESAGPTSYVASDWSCVKNAGVPITGSSVTIASGDAVVCTITNTFVQQTAKLTITKIVSNTHGGNNVIADFALSAKNDSTAVVYPAVSSVQITVPVGNAGTVYTAREIGVTGYEATFGGDCSLTTHKVTLLPGDVKSCAITNRDLVANITLIKVVQGGTALPEDFELTVDGTIVPQNASFGVTSNSAHAINENPQPGYHFVSMTGAGCPASLGGTATLNEGQSIACTITNAVNP